MRYDSLKRCQNIVERTRNTDNGGLILPSIPYALIAMGKTRSILLGMRVTDRFWLAWFWSMLRGNLGFLSF